MPTITLPDDTEILLDKLARHRGVSREAVLAQFVEAWVEDMEDVTAATEAMADYNPAENVPLEEVMRKYGLDDRTFEAGQQAA